MEPDYRRLVFNNIKKMKKMKKLFWTVRSNGDMLITVEDLETVRVLIESDIEELTEDEAESYEYTVTPTYMTQEEFDNREEAND